MSAPTQEPYHVINLFDWAGGIRDKRRNPLVYPENALMSGENVDLINQGLKTRKGFSLAATIAKGTVILDGRATVQRLVIEGFPPRWALTAIYDPVDNSALLFGGWGSDNVHNDLWRFDCGTKTIAQLEPVGVLPPPTYGHAAVYDPENRSMLVFGGATEGTKASWKYDISANTWSELPRVPDTMGSGNMVSELTAVYSSGAVYVFGGYDGARTNALYEFTVATNSWSTITPDNCAVDPPCICAHTAISVDGTMLQYAGSREGTHYNVQMWQFDPASGNWSEAVQEGDLPLGRQNHMTVWHEGIQCMIVFGGHGYELGVLNDLWAYAPPTGTWTRLLPILNDILAPRQNGAAVYSSRDATVLVFGGERDEEQNAFEILTISPLVAELVLPAADIPELEQVRFPTNQTSYLVAQVDTGSGNKLFASDTALPASNAEFTELYDLGSGAGRVSVAVLNDRAVITDGINKPPLVFAGCMNPDGSDWAVPKAVMVTYDSGTNWHDITTAVCDKDPDTYGNVGGLTQSSGWLAVCTDMSGVAGFLFELESGNTTQGPMTVEGYSGSWGSGYGWVDATSGLAIAGTVVPSGNLFRAEYHVLNSVPGYWFRLMWPSGTSQETSIRRILFRAPCQELQVIGEGQPDMPLGFLFRDESESSTKDFTVEVSDATYPTFARLNDGGLENPSGMQSADSIFIGYLTRFNSLEITPHNDYHNTSGSVLSGQYWQGAQWVELPGFGDQTQEPPGTPLGKKGRISWVAPSDWKQNRPVSPQYPHGYWIRLQVSAPLTPKTYISEANVWPVMTPLKKHKFAVTVRDRMVLCNRTDAPDQIDLSRALEEYGFAGADSASLRIGGQGETVAAVEAFNQGFIAKTDDWYLLNGYSPQTFSVERAEAAGQAPINNQVVVRAPHTEADLKNLMGLYYINQAGAWYFAGLKVYQISQDVSWWDPAAELPRLDLDNLYKACGVYWPERNWVIWSVPMIIEGTSQSANNRVIVYDLTLHTWLPPFTIALGAIATAYHYNATAPGRLGQLGLYAGDHHGRIVRLFGPDDATDLGTRIQAWAETGWLHFGSPEYRKILRILTVYGKTTADRLTVHVSSDGDNTSPILLTYQDLTNPGNRLFAQEQESNNIQGRFFKFRISFSDETDVYGLQIGASVIREWGKLA